MIILTTIGMKYLTTIIYFCENNIFIISIKNIIIFNRNYELMDKNNFNIYIINNTHMT